MPTASTTKKRYTASDLAHDVLLAAMAVAAILSVILLAVGGLEQ